MSEYSTDGVHANNEAYQRILDIAIKNGALGLGLAEQGGKEGPEAQFLHYFKRVGHLQMIDVYRVLDLFEVTNPCVQHAVKKLLCAGKRGNKDYKEDLREAEVAINRALEMIDEDQGA